MIQTQTASTSPRFETATEVEVSRYDQPAPYRTTWWSSIVAGAFTAMALMVIFAVMGTAIGLSVVSAAEDTPEAGLSIGGAIYWVITGLIALFVGGWIASRLRNTADTFIGAMHGFLVWCTVTVLSSVLVVMAGGAAIGGSLAAVGDVMARNESVSSKANSNPDRDAGSSDNVPAERQTKEAAKNAAGASWWTLIALALGASVASLGGHVATRNDRRDFNIKPRTDDAYVG